MSGSNPTLSANMSFFVFSNLAGHVGSQRAGRFQICLQITRKSLKKALTPATWVLQEPARPNLRVSNLSPEMWKVSAG